VDKANGFAYSGLLSGEERSRISDLILNQKLDFEYFKVEAVHERYMDDLQEGEEGGGEGGEGVGSK